ncbi:MAG: DHCW motif cupin fold protein [Bacteroidia bacterium]
MKIDETIKLSVTDWDNIPGEKHMGVTGYATWKIMQLGNIRVRMVEYSADYLADHWCDKGHIIYCIEGQMTTVVKDGRKFILKKGMTYQVGDNAESHRTFSETGVKLFIVD